MHPLHGASSTEPRKAGFIRCLLHTQFKIIQYLLPYRLTDTIRLEGMPVLVHRLYAPGFSVCQHMDIQLLVGGSAVKDL